VLFAQLNSQLSDNDDDDDDEGREVMKLKVLKTK
jgi:hypothetical protein